MSSVVNSPGITVPIATTLVSTVAPALNAGNNTGNVAGSLSDNPAITVTRLVSGTGAAAHGFSDESEFLETGQGYNSFDSICDIGASATGAYDHCAGYQARAKFKGGTITNFYGYHSKPEVHGSGAVIANVRHFVVSNAVKVSSGAVTTQYGLHIETLTAGTNNMAIASDGAARSYHNGRWCFGTTSYSGIDPSAMVQINSTSVSGDSLHRGFLLPRVTTAQKTGIVVTAASAGLTVYDTTLNKMCIYNGSTWETVTSV